MDPKGYGRFSITPREAVALGLSPRTTTIKAHRAALIADGRNPGALKGLHHCDNPPCIRPDHLYVGTPADNARDMAERGRTSVRFGVANPATKLSREQVAEIRARVASESCRALAREFGVAHTTISKVARGIFHAQA